jgi:hypothetical protein
MERTYSQIDMDERRKIARWRTAGMSVAHVVQRPLTLTVNECSSMAGPVRVQRMLAKLANCLLGPQTNGRSPKSYEDSWPPAQKTS